VRPVDPSCCAIPLVTPDRWHIEYLIDTGSPNNDDVPISVPIFDYVWVGDTALRLPGRRELTATSASAGSSPEEDAFPEDGISCRRASRPMGRRKRRQTDKPLDVDPGHPLDRPPRGPADPLSPGQRSTIKQRRAQYFANSHDRLTHGHTTRPADADGRPPPLNRGRSTCGRIPLRQNYPQANRGQCGSRDRGNHLGDRVIHREMGFDCGKQAQPVVLLRRLHVSIMTTHKDLDPDPAPAPYARVTVSVI
jgi:hypothetical protein